MNLILYRLGYFRHITEAINWTQKLRAIMIFEQITIMLRKMNEQDRHFIISQKLQAVNSRFETDSHLASQESAFIYGFLRFIIMYKRWRYYIFFWATLNKIGSWDVRFFVTLSRAGLDVCGKLCPHLFPKPQPPSPCTAILAYKSFPITGPWGSRRLRLQNF